MPSTPPIDLIDAVLQHLRASICADVFGDTYDPGPPASGVQKFFGDFASEVSPPYLIVTEPSETRQYMTKGLTGTPFLANGSFQVAIFDPTRDMARQLGDMVGLSLNDARLVWIGMQNMMGLRLMTAFFAPTPAIGPGIPTIFNRVLSFTYAYQGVL